MFVLPPLALWGLTLLAFERLHPAVACLRHAFLVALLLTSAFIALSTELLSAFTVLSADAVRTAWMVFVCGVWGYWFLKPDRLLDARYRAWQRIRAFGQTVGTGYVLLLGTLLGLMAVVALFSAPNNSDSLSYHLSRLVYWTQQQSVAHYASHSERATSFPPFSSYIHLHLYLLSGSDRWFQLVSWTALVGALCAISLLTQRFTASVPALRLAVLAAATMPMLVLEAMTTQNDVLVGFWCLSLVWYLFGYLDFPTPRALVLVALCTALGVATKATFEIFLAPLGLGLGLLVLHRQGLGAATRLTVATVLAVAVCNGPFWARNYALYQTPIGHFAGGNQNHDHSLPAVVSSAAKHTLMHLGIASPGDRYNAFLRTQLTRLHDWLGVALDDPGTTQPFKLIKLNFSEDFAHNFLAAWLLVLAGILLTRRAVPVELRWYALGVGAGYLVFCALIGYQWYGARLHSPFFLLAAPVLGIVYGTLPGRTLQGVLRGVLTLGAVPYLLFSTARPLVSTAWLCESVFPVVNERLGLGLSIDGLSGLKRPSILTASAERQLWDDTTEESRALRRLVQNRPARSVGFAFSEGSLDYAYQHTLRDLNLTFRHVLVANYSKPLEDSTFYPDCIVSETRRDSLLWCRRKPYVRTWRGTRCALYVPAGGAAPVVSEPVLAALRPDSLGVQASIHR